MYRLVRYGLLAVTLLTVAFPARADKGKPQGDPKELGRVAILPFLDITGERQEAKNEYRDTALDEVRERCRKYEITFVPTSELQAALKELNLVPTDEEDRTKAKLKQLADRLKAHYVVTGTLLDAKTEIRRNNDFQPPKANQAKVQFRVFNAETGRYADDLELTATSTARGGYLQRSNKLRVKAIRDATKKAMAAFLAPYPKVHDEVPDEKSE